MHFEAEKPPKVTYNLRERSSKANQKRLEFQQILNEAKKHMAENESNLLSRYLSEEPTPNSDHLSLNNVYFNQHPENRPIYEHIVCNDSTSIESSQKNSSINRGSSRWICDCQVPNKEALLNGELPCMSECINKALNIECGPRCPVFEICGNRRFQRMEYASVEPFFAGTKGWGLKATDFIEKGTFIIEYVGEVISFREFQRRIRKYEKQNSPHHYFMSSGPSFFIDAAKKGNWARFINHSCQPNAETQKWNVLGSNCIGIFAIEDIEKDEEITMDYQFIQFGIKEQKCYCGSENCSGVMGISSKNFQNKVCTKDTKSIEKRALRLLELEKIRTSHEITLLLQVMVQECLNQYARYRLLGLLRNCENDSLYTLFRQYNGLELIASYMCDSETFDWPMKKRILECLMLIPITERKQVNTDSRLMEIVEQWSKDPKYCRARIDNPIQENISNQDENKVIDLTDEDNEINEISPINEDNQAISQKPIESQDLGAILSREAIIQQELKNWIEPATKEEIIQLASQLLTKWEDIPWECYRIPRRDRQVTEESLLMNCHEDQMEEEEDDIHEEIDCQKKRRIALPKNINKNCVQSNNTTGHLSMSSSKNEIKERNKSEKKRINLEKRMKHREIFEEKIQKMEEAKQKTRLREEQVKKLEISIKNLDQVNCKQLLKIICKALAMHMTKLEAILKENSTDKRLDEETIYRLTSSVQQLSLRLPSLYQMEDVTGAILFLVEMTNDCKAIQEIVDNLYNKQLKKKRILSTNDEMKSTSASPTIPPVPNNNTDTNHFEDKNDDHVKNIEGLPFGWQSSLDPLTGHKFYYNISLGKTQWTFPSVPIVSEFIGDPSNIPLPPQKDIIPAPTVMEQDQKKDDSASKKTNQLYMRISALVHKTLKPYTLNNCVTGRITSSQDLQHLTKKFSCEFYTKLYKHQLGKCELNKSTCDKLRAAITKYMLSKGPVYYRTKPPSAVTN